MKKAPTITNFYTLGLFDNDELTFEKNPEIKAYVASESTVMYEDKEYSLSNLTKVLMSGKDKNNTGQYNGWNYWLFNGKTIASRRTLRKEHLMANKTKQILMLDDDVNLFYLTPKTKDKNEIELLFTPFTSDDGENYYIHDKEMFNRLALSGKFHATVLWHGKDDKVSYKP